MGKHSPEAHQRAQVSLACHLSTETTSTDLVCGPRSWTGYSLHVGLRELELAFLQKFSI